MTSSCMTSNNNVMFDDASVMWIDADYIFQNSKMPLSTFQQLLFSIPSIHRKMINDIGNPPACSFPPSNNNGQYMVDIYGAAVLTMRSPSLFSDQLLTTFIANNYMSFCNRQRPCPPPPQPQTPPFDCAQKQIVNALEKLAHQNDLLINSVNQISLNQSNQFLELRTQYAQIVAALENAKDTILNRLNVLVDEIKAALPDQSAQLQEQIDKLLEAINVVAQTLRSEMNNTNSILTNLASSITNINSTLNNLLTAIEGITSDEGGGGLGDADRQKLSDVLDLVTEIRNILMGSRK
ncbi:major polyhedral calyx protein [Choristoneura fumiferana DEF multiple nucleopolyhedrovirus]|uniref:Major polyhedral calyx protein n=1 Tax=Choristoneura fumiferana defective polyhedrosis virus TaxID=74660 RepID=Q6VTL3_NPVCD|nr:major polyhedral calyx protein [Choristoneura fumiferana DEF multiple nucleopolyhedrovirus]AAQ91686.1 major polyhedral calyx protein [Choristoneura fumiferana DEF multiple nucleopolyhedrovirus]